MITDSFVKRGELCTSIRSPSGFIFQEFSARRSTDLTQVIQSLDSATVILDVPQTISYCRWHRRYTTQLNNRKDYYIQVVGSKADKSKNVDNRHFAKVSGLVPKNLRCYSEASLLPQAVVCWVFKRVLEPPSANKKFSINNLVPGTSIISKYREDSRNIRPLRLNELDPAAAGSVKISAELSNICTVRWKLRRELCADGAQLTDHLASTQRLAFKLKNISSRIAHSTPHTSPLW
ncbi:unnamed protein product [Chrysodeixis includens]|uniref:Uncharacterized protein n=1 Tax=Chrysodeixis includens TaxID=689277 RepID=A0A9N8KTF3_CHRIL|nr:unnamed protein product [Chrysodeixis includens]